MNPPLDPAPLLAADPQVLPPLLIDAREPLVMTPHALHDLRGEQVRELRYPAGAVVVVGGIPGAGKSTALRRLFGLAADAIEPAFGRSGTLLVDSQQSRKWWERRFGALPAPLNAIPYPLWRPIVHVTHYRRIRAALRNTRGPVIIHDCGTRGWVRRLIAFWAARAGRPLHLIMIDTPAEMALAGQVTRGRQVKPLSFRLHCRRWQRLIEEVDAGTKPRPAPTSVVVMDRTSISGLRAVSFTPGR
ncbi:ATP-binding protein [Nocardia jejuensis]|uniref:ATP-binding protein n=1 Tax=Nocardia jejuensis TaxID=328049 RepID=UPI000AC01488|nr:ATP-binding protein [Nocardia jejuensis]